MVSSRHSTPTLSVEKFHKHLIDTMSEKDFQESVMQLANLRDWLVYHVFDSRKTTSRGFPDLVLVRDGRLVFAELKTMKGRLSITQNVWLTCLRQIPSIEVYVWRPDDWEDVAAKLE